MAIKIYEQFAPFANPADGDYPHGSFKNDSIPGAEDGTPLDAVWGNDYAGSDAELFASAGIVPSGQPDKLGASQRVDAMNILSAARSQNVLDTQFILSTNTTKQLGDVLYIYDVVNQKTWSKPIVVGATETIVSVDVTGLLTTNSSTHQLQRPYSESVTSLDVRLFGVVNGVDCAANIQIAQDTSEMLQKPLDFSGVQDIRFSGSITFKSWLEWHGASRHLNKLNPLSKTRTLAGGTAWIKKEDDTVDVTHFLMQDIGINGGYVSGGTPSVENLISMVRITANGSNDKDITYLRCHFENPAHECCVHNVATTAVGVSSGGTIDGVRMLFCSGDVDAIATASRSSNMFKTIHGSIDIPGAYGKYPITNVVSFGNTCRGMRTLADFKRGTRHFTHNSCTTIDMTDVSSISVDGAKDGTIGPNNTGYQTIAAVDTKNFYELQGEDIDILGGTWDADNEADTVAAILVTDYAYPAEITGTYTGNQSVNIDIKKFTARNIAGHAIRMINTKNSSVEHILAENCNLDAVSFEYIAKLDKSGTAITPAANFCDNITAKGCRYTVSASTQNAVKLGQKLTNEFDQYDVEFPSNFKYTFTPENINKNPLVIDYAGGVSPLFWTSGSAVYSVGSAGLGFSQSFSLNDTNNAQIYDKVYSELIPLVNNEVLYFKLWVKQGTATKASIILKEYNSGGGLLTTNFIALTVGASFTEQAKKFKCTNASTAYVTVALAPAANFGGDAALTGTTEFANVRFGRKPF